MARKKDGLLVLGWKITNDQNPDYWMTDDPRPGGQTPDQLVTVDEDALANNAIIVASSGSGKSFFLGRLIEEILLRTDARILCFDPNSDFVRINSTVRGSLWAKANYDPHKPKDQSLPHEKDRLAFKRPWDRIDKRVYSASKHKPPRATPIKLDWLRYKVEWLVEDASIAKEEELRSCHEFVGELKHLFVKSKLIQWWSDHELLEFARNFWFTTRDRDADAISAKLKELFASDSKGSSFRTRQCPLKVGSTVDDFNKLIAPHIKAAAKLRAFLPDQVQRDYFGAAQAAKRSGVFGDRYPLNNEPGTTAHFVDLLSIRNPRFKHMVVLKYLEDEINDAKDLHEKALAAQGTKGAKDSRKPLFVIVDEAHHLMPGHPDTKLANDLLEKFLWLVDEGRKFGIFLILVTQQPDKVHPSIVSSCTNRALMRITNRETLEKAIKALGLSQNTREASEAARASGFYQGRAMLFGPWANSSIHFLYAAMRRTLAAGAGLPSRR
jgi:hypothetical protein